MLFGSPKSSVTSDDKNWIEEAFLFLEKEYGREYLKSMKTIEPTKEFFPIDFKGTEENAEELTRIVCGYMDIKDVQIDLHYFSDSPN